MTHDDKYIDKNRLEMEELTIYYLLIFYIETKFVCFQMNKIL